MGEAVAEAYDEVVVTVVEDLLHEPVPPTPG